VEGVETITTTLDLKGFSCPIPIAKTAAAMRKMGTGEVLEVLATDPGSVPDFAAWSKATGNPLIEQTEDDGVFRFVLRKK
jgi:tRNA 2-thiouridine synthesizing protein A